MLKKLKIPIFIFLASYLIGIVFLKIVEGWSWVDSFYFTGTTLNALGYGDFYPLTDAGKIFTTVFSFIGISAFLYVLGILASHRTEREEK